MQHSLLAHCLVVAALLAACDVAPAPDTSRIEIRSATVADDSMRLHVSVDGHDREVHIADGEATRAVAVVDPAADDPLVTLVSDADPECTTDDAVACELTEAALDGTLEELAAEVDDGQEFRLAPSESCTIMMGDYYACWVCGSRLSPSIDCVYF